MIDGSALVTALRRGVDLVWHPEGFHEWVDTDSGLMHLSVYLSVVLVVLTATSTPGC